MNFVSNAWTMRLQKSDHRRPQKVTRIMHDVAKIIKMDPFAIPQLRVPLNHNEITDLNTTIESSKQGAPLEEEEKQLVQHGLEFIQTVAKIQSEGKNDDEFRAEAETIFRQAINFLQRRGIDSNLLVRGFITPKDEIPDGPLKTAIEDAELVLEPHA